MQSKSTRSIILSILLIIVLQSLILIAMIASRQAILSSDTLVILETRPIDPRSLFRGDYVRLNYTINDLKLNELSGDSRFSRNERVYVVLKQAEQYWEAVAVYANKPELISLYPDNVDKYALIQGIVKDAVDLTKSTSAASRLEVSYGIENYFVPEGEGLKLERPQAGDEVTLKIALDKDGQAAIKALLLNGVEQYEEALF
ncbi:GDYXXLXY domain-containing protein [sulfur-oxidizing endosymbiont of Gigantopelta aegis]|uniref:GDYXXLXY domain-containing protein n=1 Tax=sulfur-oxidizing endosymbiont of Gigantopelta aegis TaxID=2794934 RepID=UPI0018DDDBE8|nr:GDYXXLXY domain-containing protein [sulfur-oxidizing endosymbiont of Gigantopelta aegis]